jgi:formylglycine-generating enzyme required for sulfatase activity
MLSRPSLDLIVDWRAHVDKTIRPLLADPACAPLIELGIAHEQQHQELLLTDIKHALFQNPLGVSMWALPEPVTQPTEKGAEWHEHPGGIALVGHQGEDFAFDNEGPPHRVMLEPFALAGRLVSNGEWEQFIADGGYRTPRCGSPTGGTGSSARGFRRRSTGTRASISPTPGGRCAIRGRRCATSRTSRPTPSPPGPARGCRPSSNGKRSLRPRSR